MYHWVHCFLSSIDLLVELVFSLHVSLKNFIIHVAACGCIFLETQCVHVEPKINEDTATGIPAQKFELV